MFYDLMLLGITKTLNRIHGWKWYKFSFQLYIGWGEGREGLHILYIRISIRISTDVWNTNISLGHLFLAGDINTCLVSFIMILSV